MLALLIHAPFSSGYFHHSTSTARRISIPTALSELISFTKYIYWEHSQAVRLLPGCQAPLQVTVTTYRNTQGKQHLLESHKCTEQPQLLIQSVKIYPALISTGMETSSCLLKAEELSTVLVARAFKSEASTECYPKSSAILQSHKQQERKVMIVSIGITIQNLSGSCKLAKNGVYCMPAVEWHTYVFRPLQLMEEKQYSTPQPLGLTPGWR